MNIHTLVIIAANLLISLRGFRDYSFFEQYKFNVGALRNGENKRWISSGFLHVDWQHFIFNNAFTRRLTYVHIHFNIFIL